MYSHILAFSAIVLPVFAQSVGEFGSPDPLAGYVPIDYVKIDTAGKPLDGTSLGLVSRSELADDLPALGDALVQLQALPALKSRQDANLGFLCLPGSTPDKNKAACYKEIRTDLRYGWQQQISRAIECTTAGPCKVETKFEYSASTEYGFSLAVSADFGIAKGVFNLGASVEKSWSWTTGTLTGSSEGFEIEAGDAGYAAFWPKIRESCGDLSITPIAFGPRGFAPAPFSKSSFQTNQQNACASTPIILPGGQPDGVVKFCHTKGPRKGEGCEHPALE